MTRRERPAVVPDTIFKVCVRGRGRQGFLLVKSRHRASERFNRRSSRTQDSDSTADMTDHNSLPGPRGRSVRGLVRGYFGGGGGGGEIARTCKIIQSCTQLRTCIIISFTIRQLVYVA